MHEGRHEALAPPPKPVDLRRLLPPVRDQGVRGTCLAFAVTAAHELARAAGGRATEDLSEEVLYWGCKQIDGDSVPGSAFPSAAAALQRWGQPAEQLWPYDGSIDDTTGAYAPPQGALDPAVCHKARLRQINTTIPEIKRWLAAGSAVALGILLSRGFHHTADGWIPLPGPHELLAEGHAILVVGYDDGVPPGDGWVIFRNSWGPGWGDGGYGYLPYTYIQRHGCEAWVVD